MTIKEVRVTDEKADSSLQVRIATQSWEKSEIYRLRYEVYVQEMAKPLGSTIDKTKQIVDSLDDRSALIYVQAGSAIVATQRITIAAAEDYPIDLAEAFHMHKFKTLYTDFSDPHFGLGTKLAIKAQYRNSPALYLILAEAYRLMRDQKIPICFTGGNPYVIPLYERVGFRRFAHTFTDPGYSLLIPLVMLLEDTDHLKAVKSPIMRLARKYVNDVTMAQRFLQLFPEASKCLNTQLVTRKSLWEYLERTLGDSPLTIPVFKHLDAESIMDLLLAGMVFSCAEGDCILYQDSICNDLYILISGNLVSTSPSGSYILGPGEYFGGITRPNQSRQAESVSTLTDSELFMIPRQAFERYQNLHQEASEILLSNLKSINDFTRACSINKQGGQ
ncbi:cyclic nucleotide-binding domain-containing protein [Sporomusa sp.]|uniref:cyclic nucleotide-binding domain-containing protein n=1 Tax=Sporomusa sp. TaxID=2078658 RepID=UPI002C2792DC|nr:cyclic nucleotide-binding domain-containing protein [Sporomusa sp.]HWR44214.1 cyclic nucleotide-binding domain-containing protein [Sporomusa sp.]